MSLFEQFKHCLSKSKKLSVIYENPTTDDGEEDYSIFTVPCKSVSITVGQLVITMSDSYKMSFDVDWNKLVATSCNEYSYVGRDSGGCLFWVQ